MGGRDKEFVFLSVKRKKKGKESYHLVLWSLENVIVCESLGKGNSYARGTYR
jgi:hypothetical protein